MSGYSAIRDTLQQEYKERAAQYRERLALWHDQPGVVRAERPTNLTRARELGYKAKEGIIIVRVRVRSGTRKRKAADGGRKPSKSGRFFSRTQSLQSIAEGRAASKFTNYEVLNSYFVGNNGYEKFYEVIALDRNNGALLADPVYSCLIVHRNRALRGLTASGRRHRGLERKGFGTYKARPSKRSSTRA